MKYFINTICATLLVVCTYQIIKISKLNAEIEIQNEKLNRIKEYFGISLGNDSVSLNENILLRAKNLRDQLDSKTAKINESESQLKSMNTQLLKATSLNRNYSSIMMESQKQKQILKSQIANIQRDLLANESKLRETIQKHQKEITVLKEVVETKIKQADASGYRRGMSERMARRKASFDDRPSQQSPLNDKQNLF